MILFIKLCQVKAILFQVSPDKKCEYLSFPDLVSKGKFGYHPWNINIHMSWYFNQRLLNYTQRFSSNSD